VHVAHEAIVTACDELRAGLYRMLAEVFLQQLVFNAVPPDRVGLSFIFWPWNFLPAELDRLGRFEIERLIELCFTYATRSSTRFW